MAILIRYGGQLGQFFNSHGEENTHYVSDHEVCQKG